MKPNISRMLVCWLVGLSGVKPNLQSAALKIYAAAQQMAAGISRSI
jgi:hypothetical protein